MRWRDRNPTLRHRSHCAQACLGTRRQAASCHPSPQIGRPRTAKATGTRTRNGRGRIDAMARCDSPSPCPTARPRSCMRQTRHRGRGSTTSWRQLSPSSSCRRTTSGASYWGGRPHGTPGDQAVRLIHPSTTCQSPKTQQDHERGDELTARVFAPGRSILSTMGAIL